MSTRRTILVAALGTLLTAGLIVAIPSTAKATALMCAGQEATIVGTGDADIIEGTEGDDVIVAQGGDDIIFTFGGDDVICAGRGDDVVFAGEGDDFIAGQRGTDFLYGGPGRDAFKAGAGADVVEGGPGITKAQGQTGNDELWGSWCHPPSTMSHFCRWPDLTVPPAEYAELLDGTRILELGSTGEDVRQLQELLTELEHYSGSIDGVFGTDTEAAVIAFQEANDLEPDGKVGPATRAALAEAAGSAAVPDLPDDWILGKARTLRSGHLGSDVAALQRSLDAAGYDPGPVDGAFGAQTVAAVEALQADSGLDVDGVVGAVTKRAIFGDVDNRKVLRGGKHFDTCNSGTQRIACENKRGLRPGAPWNAEAAEEWRPLITEVFTEWDLEDEIERAIAITACESLADPMITTPAGSGFYWIGLFQHTDRYWDARADRAGIPGTSPYDPWANATVAALLVRESTDSGHSRGPWAHWGCGSLLGYWP